MTPELAALLDGPVAERWGRPTAMGGLHLRPIPSGGWTWANQVPDKSFRLMPDDVAEALWLAHMLDVCGKRGWVAMLTPGSDGWGATIIDPNTDDDIDPPVAHPTILEALALAMLAVPEPQHTST